MHLTQFRGKEETWFSKSIMTKILKSV